jgi:L-malate glycosyltransferase
MKRLRVAIVAPSLDILGGQAVQAQRLLDGWRGDPDVDARLVPVNPVPPGPFRHARKIKGVRTAVTQAVYWPLLVRALARADVVHVFSASYLSFLLAPLPAITVARALGKPVLLNYRSGEAPDHLKRSAVARRAAARCDRIAVPSAFLAGVFGDHGLATRIIPNTVDVDRFAFRRRSPLRPNLVSVRSLEPMYNVACTLRAFRLVQNLHPEASLTLAGHGSQLRPLLALAGELGLQHVRFTGPVAPADVWRLYADADIYVQTPDIDNMPSSVLEAYSSGTPVVATAAGGVPVILQHDVHGLLAPLNDHETMATHILRLLDEPEVAERLATTARASCERYRWSEVRRDWLALYREMCFDRLPSVAEARS